MEDVGNRMRNCFELTLEFGVGPNNFPSIVAEDFPFLRQAECSCVSFNESFIEVVLHGLKFIGDGCLRNSVSLRCQGEAFCFNQVQEYF